MLINILDINGTDENSVALVTNGNEERQVTARQIFEAMIDRKMESQTVRLTVYGLDILMNGQVYNINIKIKSAERKKLNVLLGLEEDEVVTKQMRLEAERKAFLERDKQRHLQHQAMAEEIRARGEEPLTPEQRRERRIAYIHNNNK